MVKVYATSDEMVKALKHPLTKQGFVSKEAAVNWPDDTFTRRRIRDGDVSTDAPAPPPPEGREDQGENNLGQHPELHRRRHTQPDKDHK
jgi:hypothetical protein